MIEDLEYRGYWHTPETPDNQIAGTLTFSPDQGAKLDLIGSFYSYEDHQKIVKLRFILGTAHDGTRITLFGCFLAELKSGSGGFTSRIDAELVFIGVHFREESELQFTTFAIHYSNLDDWAGISGFLGANEHHNRDETVIRFKNPDPTYIVTIADHKVFIDIDGYETYRSHERTIRQKAYVRVESPKPKALVEFMGFMDKIANFLTLAVGWPIHPQIIKAVTPARTITVEGEEFHPPIDVMYSLITPAKDAKHVISAFMLFTFSDIRERAGLFLGNWFDKAEFMRPVYDLYFGALYNPNQYVQSSFLGFAQALETYHRRTRPDYILPEEEFQKRTEAIIASAPEDYRVWLKEKLEYSNRLPLRRRLKELVTEYSYILGDDVSKKQLNAFVDSVATTRNYLTHYSESLEHKTADNKELVNLARKLQTIVEACLLREVGFNFDETKALIQKKQNRRYGP